MNEQLLVDARESFLNRSENMCQVNKKGYLQTTRIEGLTSLLIIPFNHKNMQNFPSGPLLLLDQMVLQPPTSLLLAERSSLNRNPPPQS